MKYIGCKQSSTFLGNKYLGSGTLLQEAVKQLGTEHFTVELLEECDTKVSMQNAEREWISKHNAVESTKYYNQCDGGATSAGYKHTDECKNKMKEAWKLRKQNYSHSTQGKIRITNQEEDKYIFPEELDKYEALGYTKGMSEACKMNSSQPGEKNYWYGKSEHFLGEKNAFYGKHHDDAAKKEMSIKHTGRIHVNNGVESLVIHPEELDAYIAKGYVRGRISNGMSGRLGINKDGVMKRIKPDELESYLSQGWSRGYPTK